MNSPAQCVYSSSPVDFDEFHVTIVYTGLYSSFRVSQGRSTVCLSVLVIGDLVRPLTRAGWRGARPSYTLVYVIDLVPNLSKVLNLTSSDVEAVSE